MESIARLAREFGDRLLIGAGTVMTAGAGGGDRRGRRQADRHAACRCGGGAGGEAARAAGGAGFFTPAEAFAMLAAGADALKLFPAEAASPAVLRALRAVLPPGTAVLPVGGIDASNMAAGRRRAPPGSASARRSIEPATVRRRLRPRRTGW